MAQVLVRELEDEVVTAIKRRARAHHRSLEGEVRAILKDIAVKDRRRDEFMRELEKLHAELAGQPQTDSVELLHEARAEWEEKWHSS